MFSLSLYSQNIVDIAKRERERRKKIKKKVEVINNGNLREKRYKKSYAFVIVKNKNSVKPQPSNKLIPKQYYESWRKEYLKYIKKIKDLNKKINKEQKKCDAMNFKFKITHNPNEKFSLPAKIDKILKEIKKMKNKLKKLNQDFENFKERARKKGVPPGYLR
jgi:molecular chaperone GrpE (heat shock protein)